MASRKGSFSGASAESPDHPSGMCRNCTQSRRGTRPGHRRTELCFISSGMNGELSERREGGRGRMVNSAGCYGNNGGQGVLKCHRSELFVFQG